MRIAFACLMAVLVCSCREDTASRTSTRSQIEAKHPEEVRRVISSYLHSGIGSILGPLTVAELDRELAEMGKALSLGEEEVVIGGPDWDRLKAELRQGGELYFCRSDDRSWENLGGWEGYVVVRVGSVVAVMPTAVN